jgi:hypothetical protein
MYVAIYVNDITYFSLDDEVEQYFHIAEWYFRIKFD